MLITAQNQQDPNSLCQELNGDVENNTLPSSAGFTKETLCPHCIGLNPLSEILCKTSHRYQQQNGAIVNHLLCMDDVKLYARSGRDIDSLIHTTRVYSNGISFGKERSGSQN